MPMAARRGHFRLWPLATMEYIQHSEELLKFLNLLPVKGGRYTQSLVIRRS